MRWLFLWIVLSLPAWAQDEGNIGRTEADDEAEEQPVGTQLGRLGPVQIPFTVAATIGLYTPQGRLVRILGQVLNLKKGEYSVRWDGLDLFGNVVPADTALEVKLITNQPIKAFYEFSVSAPKVAPWGGNFAGKAGGWLADHSAPNSLTAIGDKVLIGSFLAEHGNNLIAVNLAGEKLWGMNLAGWTGPAALANDDKYAYALMRNRNSIVRVDPDVKEKGDRKPVYIAGKDKVQAFAVRDGKFYLVKKNHRYGESPFEVALSNGRIDFTKSRPQVLNNDTPTEFMIGAQTAWGNTFTSPGNPQNGAGMVVKNSEAFALVVFKEPVTVGTLVLGKVGGAGKAFVYALNSKLGYDEKYSPLNQTDDDGLNLMEFSKEWELFGESAMKEPVSLLTAKQDNLTTRALLFRCLPADGTVKDWRPRLQMARIMKERFAAVVAKPGWKQQTEVPVSEIYPFSVEVTLGGSLAMDGVLLLNCVNPDVFVDAQTANGEWTEQARYRGNFEKKLGYLSSSKSSNEQCVHFNERVTTAARRFRHHSGYRQGKWGPGKDDSHRIETDFVVPVRLVSERDRRPSRLFEVLENKTVTSWAGNEYDLPAIAFAPNGTLFSIAGNRLCRTEIAGNGLKHTPLGDFVFT